MADYDYDLFTIGAGSGGVRASRLAAETGARVGVAEEYRVGGTCVIRGCVPKKLFVFASEFASTFRDAEGFGWSKTGGEFDWSRLVADKDAEIDRLNDIYIANLKKAGVEIINSRATLRDPHTIYLENEGRTVTAKTILIATGATPRVDTTIAGHEIAVSSNELFHLEELPKRIVIYGGGYIAVEFAGIFHALGVKTTLVYRGQQILRGFDSDMRHWLSLELVRQGINLVTETTLTDIEKIGRDHVVSLSSGRSLTTDLVVFAIGRDPNTQGLGLETAGVEVGRNGRIEVDAHSKTSADNIYAVGDVTDRVALTPVAIKEGAAFVETVFK
ncbi:MAG: FAD-dependent oxidoreductase, partial [Pseudomonadota bacterium]